MNSRIRFWARRHMGVGLVAALVATGVVTAAASPAAAATSTIFDVTLVTGHTAFNSDVYKSVTVTCPKGLQIIGTGYEFVGAAGSVVLDDLIPTATTLRVGAGEVVGVGEPSDGTKESWKISARALCADPPPGLQIGSQTSGFGKGSGAIVRADCPVGRVLLGAGASLSQGFGQISIDSLSFFDTFAVATARDDEDGYTGEWSITVYSICAFPIEDQQIITENTFGDSAGQTATAICPVGTRALGTGWSVFTHNGSGEVYVTGSSTFADGGTVSAHEDANGFDGGWTTTADVMCVRDSGRR